MLCGADVQSPPWVNSVNVESEIALKFLCRDYNLKGKLNFPAFLARYKVTFVIRTIIIRCCDFERDKSAIPVNFPTNFEQGN